MLYHLLTPLADQHQFFNLFRYITFRTAWGMVTSLAICYALYPWFIEFMKNLALIGGLLMVVSFGPGPVSFDGPSPSMKK